MSEVMQCDRCEAVFDKGKWAGQLRGKLVVKEHTKAATAYNPSEYDVCDDCIAELFDWIDTGGETDNG